MILSLDYLLSLQIEDIFLHKCYCQQYSHSLYRVNNVILRAANRGNDCGIYFSQIFVAQSTNAEIIMTAYNHATTLTENFSTFDSVVMYPWTFNFQYQTVGYIYDLHKCNIE